MAHIPFNFQQVPAATGFPLCPPSVYRVRVAVAKQKTTGVGQAPGTPALEGWLEMVCDERGDTTWACLKLVRTYFFTLKALPFARRFFDACGHDIKGLLDAGQGLDDAMLLGREMLVNVTIGKDNNGKDRNQYDQETMIGATAPSNGAAAAPPQPAGFAPVPGGHPGYAPPQQQYAPPQQQYAPPAPQGYAPQPQYAPPPAPPPPQQLGGQGGFSPPPPPPR